MGLQARFACKELERPFLYPLLDVQQAGEAAGQ